MRYLSVLLCLLALPACSSDGPPEYPLRVVMLEVEISRQEIGKALLREDGAAAASREVATIRKWFADPAVGRYFERKDILGTRADFDTHEQTLLGVLDELDRALGAGEMQAARDAFPRLQAACNDCHAVFRPDLPSR